MYCADQSMSRGGRTWRRDGKYWRRDFAFHIPVRNPEIWNDANVKERLANVLSFFSEDNYEFSFRRLEKEIQSNLYLGYYKDVPRFQADSVILFSGGLDSLAGAADEICAQGK